MTNEELINKIKAEIERLKEENRKIKCQANERYCSGYDDAFYDLVHFLDALESEKPMNLDLEIEVEDYVVQRWQFAEDLNAAVPIYLYDMTLNELKDCARHFAQWGKEHAKIDVTDFCKPIDPGIAQCIADHSWEMLGEDEKPAPNDLEEAADNHIHEVTDAAGHPSWEWITQDIKDAFFAGAKWQKSQMLKEAVEADVNTYRDLAAGKSWAEFVVEKPPKNLGDKVRIIIVKED